MVASQSGHQCLSQKSQMHAFMFVVETVEVVLGILEWTCHGVLKQAQGRTNTKQSHDAGHQGESLVNRTVKDFWPNS